MWTEAGLMAQERHGDFERSPFNAHLK